MTKVIVVNGPNLGRLGVRQPDVYGRQDLDTLRKLCTEWGKDLGLEVRCARPTTKPKWCTGCTKPPTRKPRWS